MVEDRAVPGPALAAVQLTDAPWTALGFSSGPVGAVALEFRSARVGWTLRGRSAGEEVVDGVPTSWTSEGPSEAGVHPNGAVALDHVVVATPDFARTVRALEAVGMLLRRERSAGTRRQGFFRHGEAIVEVVGPAEPAGDGPASLWGLTVTVADLDATATLLGPLLGQPRDAVQPGRRIAPVRPDAGLGVALAFMSPNVRR